MVCLTWKGMTGKMGASGTMMISQEFTCLLCCDHHQNWPRKSSNKSYTIATAPYFKCVWRLEAGVVNFCFDSLTGDRVCSPWLTLESWKCEVLILTKAAATLNSSDIVFSETKNGIWVTNLSGCVSKILALQRWSKIDFPPEQIYLHMYPISCASVTITTNILILWLCSCTSTVSAVQDSD